MGEPLRRSRSGLRADCRQRQQLDHAANRHDEGHAGQDGPEHDRPGHAREGQESMGRYRRNGDIHTSLGTATRGNLHAGATFGSRTRSSKQKGRHKAWARWTFPIWHYVSLTGVLVYFFLYQWWPAERAPNVER